MHTSVREIYVCVIQIHNDDNEELFRKDDDIQSISAANADDVTKFALMRILRKNKRRKPFRPRLCPPSASSHSPDYKCSFNEIETITNIVISIREAYEQILKS